MSPVRAPPHLPQAPGPGIVGVTQEDFREINGSPGARLCRVVTWDWDTGSPKRVGGEEGDGGEIEEEGWEESKVWDTEWWRRLLCRERNRSRPKYLPGNVFKLGSTRGRWHGKEYVCNHFSILLPVYLLLHSSHKETYSFISCVIQMFLTQVLPTHTILIFSPKHRLVYQ